MTYVHTCMHYCALYLRGLQGLDGGGLALDRGGLLTHEKAQPPETGLMNIQLSILLSVYVYQAEGYRAENTPCCMTG